MGLALADDRALHAGQFTAQANQEVATPQQLVGAAAAHLSQRLALGLTHPPHDTGREVALGQQLTQRVALAGADHEVDRSLPAPLQQALEQPHVALLPSGQQVGKFVNEHHNRRATDLLVGPPLHLPRQPGQAVGGVKRVANWRADQVWQASPVGPYPLALLAAHINQQQLQLIGRVCQRQAADHPRHQRSLAAARLASDEYVRHLRASKAEQQRGAFIIQPQQGSD